MRVVLSVVSKFHFFDLARQVEARGALERLFTGRLPSKMATENLPMSKVDAFPIFQTFYEGMLRLGFSRYPGHKQALWLAHQQLDAHVARRLPACEIFQAISYCGLKSGQLAQSKGAKWVCDAVSSHAVFQDDLLAEEFDRVGVPFERQQRRLLDYAVESYEKCDAIAVPSQFVRDSFLDSGLPAEKLHVLPFGVNLNHFHPVGMPRDNTFRILAVGHMSVRKGLHHLLEAFRKAAIPGSKLILVGSSFPESDELLRRATDLNIEVVGVVSKSELLHFYSQADVMVLSSVEEGLAYVIGEALACGCPVIATQHTGASDFFTNEIEGFIVPIRQPEVVAEKLVWLAEHPEEKQNMKAAALRCVNRIGGWDSYGSKVFEMYDKLQYLEAPK